MTAVITIINQKQPNNSFENLTGEWLEQCRLEGLSPKSVARYLYTIGKLKWWVERFHPDILHPRHFTVKEAREYLNYLRDDTTNRWGAGGDSKEKLKPATIQLYAGQASSFFGWLEQNSIIEANPFAHKSLKVSTNRSRKQPAAATVQEVPEPDLKKLLTYISTKEYIATYAGARNRAIIYLLLDTAMRRGELLSMRVCDLDMARLRCAIRGKGPERTVFFSPMAKTALADYWNRYRNKQDISPNKPYWLTSDDEPLGYESIGALFANLSKQLGIKVHCHQLRHQAASYLQNKVSLFELMEILGHKDSRSTKRYAHIRTEALAKAYEGNSPLAANLPAPEKRRRGRPRSKPQ